MAHVNTQVIATAFFERYIHAVLFGVFSASVVQLLFALIIRRLWNDHLLYQLTFSQYPYLYR